MSKKVKRKNKKLEFKKSNSTINRQKVKLSQSRSSPFDRILNLQSSIGNQMVQRLFKSGSLQAKLEIAKSNDKHEKEADRVADIVMRMPEPKESPVTGHESLGRKKDENVQTKLIAEQITPLVQRQVEPEEEEEEEPIQAKLDSSILQKQVEPEEEEEEEEEVQPKLIADSITPLVQRQAEEPEEEEEEPVQTKSNGSTVAKISPSVESGINSLSGGGQPLSKSVRNYFEPRFGYDFSNVRVHTDSKASETAKSVDAKAFTQGRNIVFGTGQYSPQTTEGKSLLGHELTHVVQQRPLAKKPSGSSEENMQREKKPSLAHRQPSINIVENSAATSVSRQAVSPPEWKAYGDEYTEYAKHIYEAVSGIGTDEEAIYEVLQKVQRRPVHIANLKEAYLKRYGIKLVAELRDEMSGDELEYALALLGHKPESKELKIKPRTYTSADYATAVSRLVEAMAGAGTDEEAIFAVLTPFSSAFDSIRKLKEAYYGKTSSGLEEDLRSEMSGSELAHALKLLHAPLLPAKGMAEKILKDAERDTAPGGACSIVSMRRYVRSYIDYHYLDGGLQKFEELKQRAPGGREYTELRETLKTKLEALLNASLAEEFINGGPVGEESLRDALRHRNVLADYGRRMHLLWQITGEENWPGTEKQYGATEALATGGKYKVKAYDSLQKISLMFGVSVESLKQLNRDKLKPTADAEDPYFLISEIIDIPEEAVPVGERIIHPVTKSVNIHDIIWEEALKPGTVIQIWSNQDAADAYGCVPGADSLGGYCGHSFIFVEYVYSTTLTPPADNQQLWPLYGASGTPLSTSGDEIASGTYRVARGNKIKHIADFFAVDESELKKLNEDKLKPNKNVADPWFNTGEVITIPRKAKPLAEIKNMYLVGQRVIDQSGYYFIPKDPTYRNKDVLPDKKQSKAKWIGGAQVWSAAKLV
jgi:LysM repeat protein